MEETTVIHLNKSSSSVYLFKMNDPLFQDKDYIKEIPKDDSWENNSFHQSILKDFHKNESILNTSPKMYRVNENIFMDDTISNIQNKILTVIPDAISIYELYLFVIVKRIFSIYDIMLMLKDRKNDVFIPYHKVLSFVSNIIGYTITDLDEKDYSIEDIISLEIHDKELYYKQPFGKQFTNKQGVEYPLYTIPYGFKSSGYKTGTVFTHEYVNNLYLDDKDIMKQTIYVCSVSDILESNNEDTKELISLYFPKLSSMGIVSETELQSKKNDLTNEQEKQPNFSSKTKLANVMHMMYHHNTFDVSYTKKGVKEISFIFYQNMNLQLPYEDIFKLLNVSQDIQFIKFNPGQKQESIYKLYSPTITTSGKKIPYLSKSAIMKLKKNTKSRMKMLYVYCVYPNQQTKEKNDEYSFEITNANDIKITIDFGESISITKINDYIYRPINNVLTKIRDFVTDNGYMFQLFESVYKKTEILNMNYEMYFNFDNKLQFHKIRNMIRPFFDVVKVSTNKMELSYKRVSNYKLMDDVERTILNAFNKHMDRVDIVKILMETFEVNEEKANIYIENWISKIKTEENLNGHRTINIKNKKLTVFPITIMKIEEDTFKVEIKNIANIEYLQPLDIYIDGIIRLSIDMGGSSLVKSSVIKSLNSIQFRKNIENEEKKEKEDKKRENEKEEENDSGNANRIQNQRNEDDDNEEDVDDIKKIYGDDIFDKPYDIVVDNRKKNENKFKIDNINLEDDSDESSNNNSNENNNNNLEGRGRKKKGDDVVNDKKISLFKDYSNEPIDGYSLGNPFVDKLQKLEPELFLTQTKDKRFNIYSRTCQTNLLRQPIVLTNEEKEHLEKTYPDSSEYLKDAMQYGTDPEKQHWYICPRYWCFKTNTPMTKEQVERGDCGGSNKIISKKDKTIPKDAYVFEFHTQSKRDIYHTDSSGNYRQLKPGFLKPETHEKGLCAPCCFKKSLENKLKDKCIRINKDIQKNGKDNKEENNRKLKRNSNANNEEGNEKENENEKEKEKEKEKKVIDNVKNKIKALHIISGDKFPIENKRIGFLPPNINNMFNNDASCVYSKHYKLKPYSKCMIHVGVEKHDTQSFIAVLANLYATNDENIMSIKEMKKRIIKSITLDIFVEVFNGNLLKIFETNFEENNKLSNNELSNQYNDSVTPEQYLLYKTSNLYKNVIEKHKDIGSIKVDILFKKSIYAFEHFKQYLNDPNVLIDYTYLWDIVCMKNDALFPKGLNLFIINIANDDVTNNISIICPTSIYAKEIYDESKPIALILKKGLFYEPVYYLKNEESQVIIKLFDHIDSPNLMKTKKIFEVIRNATMDKCKPLNSMPKKYLFKQNISLKELINEIVLYDLKIIDQVLNYDLRTIGIRVLDRELESMNKSPIMIPCYPSSYISSIDTKLMTDNTLWSSYEDTKQFLQKIYILSKGTILCKPVLKMKESGKIYGILTETNQLVPIKFDENEPEIMDDLETKTEHNFLFSDPKTILSNVEDKERKDTIHRIELENKFYNVFRTTARLVLHSIGNIKVKNELEELINNYTLFYDDKFNRVKKLLELLLENYISFENISYKSIRDINTITSCLNSENINNPNNSNLTCKKSSFCKEENGTCKLKISIKHLVSGLQNNILYFNRLSDEFIRYKGLQNYMLNVNEIIPSYSIPFKEQSDELIIMDTSLEDYFIFKDEEVINPFVTKQSTEMIQPNVSQSYSKLYQTNRASIKNSNEIEELDTTPEKEIKLRRNACITNLDKPIIVGNDMKGLLKGCSQYTYNNTVNCTYELMLHILYKKTNTYYTVEYIKNELILEYRKYRQYLPAIKSLMKQQTKLSLFIKDPLLEDVINSDIYYLTNIDFILLCKRFYIHLILLTTAKNGLLEMKYTKDKSIRKKNKIWISPYYEDNRDKPNIRKLEQYEYVIIKQPGLKKQIPNYSIIQKENDEIFINIKQLEKENKHELFTSYLTDTQSIEDVFLQYM